MPITLRSAASSLVVLLVLLLGATFALAQPEAEDAPAPEPAASEGSDITDDGPPPVTAETKELAKVHFKRGLKLLREEAWSPALAEFLQSRELFPTRVATNNAGIALRKLQRYDEALDMFETLLRDFEVPD
ncbi:MAG: PEGA domain-containing protein, partial [Myxococcales bacterium]|nr:PEGA domain-containing protein [Myxococcales bacterium]